MFLFRLLYKIRRDRSESSEGFLRDKLYILFILLHAFSCNLHGIYLVCYSRDFDLTTGCASDITLNDAGRMFFTWWDIDHC